MLYNFGYKLNEIRSIFSTLQFTTHVVYSVQLYEYVRVQMYCTGTVHYTVYYLYTWAGGV